MAGRPKEYTEEVALEIAERLPDMFQNGESVAEVCAELGMCKETFYRLAAEYPEFSNAYKKGLQLSEAWWTKLGRAGAAGKVDIQPTTWIFNMKNRFKWTDRLDHTTDGGELPAISVTIVRGKDGDSDTGGV